MDPAGTVAKTGSLQLLPEVFVIRQHLVLDGKQRLLCLRQFTANPDDPVYSPFKLTDLIVRTDLNGKSFGDISNDPRYHTDSTAFENYGIRAVVLRNWKTEKLLGHVFLRLNMGSKALSPQELRQALHPGPFLDFADEASMNSTAIREILGNNEPDFRMRDVELLIRYLSFRHLLGNYRGNLKEFLDNSCAQFNRRWASIKTQFSGEIDELDLSHSLVKRSFGTSYNYGKFVAGSFESRFNRAVFDVILHSLASSNVRAKVASRPEKMAKAFKQLCTSDSRFLDAIERTTKSVESTRYRMDAWYSALAAEYKVSLNPPKIGN